jgi:hypothetical protein
LPTAVVDSHDRLPALYYRECLLQEKLNARDQQKQQQ